jgi:Domain of unknown function DUF29
MKALWIIVLSFVPSTAGAFTPRYCRVAQRHAFYIDHVSGPSRLNSVSEDGAIDHDDVATGDLSTPRPLNISLYEQDFVAWLDDTAAKLKEGNFAEIDIVSLVEEMEGLARSKRQVLESHLEVLLTHLLKRMYVAAVDDCRSWELTIREQRRQLESLLEDSPSIRSYWMEVFPDVWIESSSDV